MLKKLKKGIISTIVCCLILPMMNISVFANMNANELNPGEVIEQKRAQWVDYSKGIAEISFDVVGKNAEEPLDVAIIYDNSGSMQNITPKQDYLDSAWYHTATASKIFSEELLKSEENRIALIPFSDVLIDGDTIHTNPADFFETHALLYDKNGNPDIAKMLGINNLYDNVEKGYMNMDEFYAICKEYFNVLPSDIVEKNNVHNALIPFTNDKEILSNAVDSLYPSFSGTTNYEIALNKAKEMFETSTAKQKIIVMISDGKPDEGKDGVKIAAELKKQGITIFTFGSNLSNGDASFLKAIASKVDNQPLFTNTKAENLENALMSMRKQFNVAAHDASIYDEINTEYFEYYSDDTYKPSVNGIELTAEDFVVSDDKSSITWKINNITENKKTLKFYVKVKDTILNSELLHKDESFLNMAGSYATNKNATLTYTKVNSDEVITHDMLSPKLDVKTATLKLTNSILIEDNKSMHEVESFIETNKVLGYTYQIAPQDFIYVDGKKYTLIEEDKQNHEVIFTNEDVYREFNFRYVEQVSVRFDTNGFGQFEDLTSLKDVEIDNTTNNVTEMPVVQDIPSNMYFVGWNTKANGLGDDFTSSTLVNESMIVYAKYAYYPLNVVFQDEDGTIFKQDQVAYGSDAIAPADPVKDGYTFTGWNIDYTNVKTDLVVTAMWEKVTPTPPTTPEEPVEPTPPTTPEEPVEPTPPTTPEEPVEPTPPTTPEEPVEPTPPVTPGEPVEPTPPVTPGEPVEPTPPTTPEEPVAPTPPTTPVEPSRPIVTPTEPVAPTIPVVIPTTPEVPVEPTPNTNPNPPQENQDPEIIPEEDTPLADDPETEIIPEQETPLANGEGNSAWALINLLCSIATVLLGIVIVFKKQKTEEENNENEENETKKKYRKATALCTITIAILSIIAFILTENMSLPMILVDKWTLAMMLFPVCQIILFFFMKHKENAEEEVVSEAQN